MGLLSNHISSNVIKEFERGIQTELKRNSKKSHHKFLEAHEARQRHTFPSVNTVLLKSDANCQNIKDGIENCESDRLLITQWLQILADTYCMILNNYSPKPLSPHL